MSATGKSSDKVHYEFRPAKQVERRMLLDLLQRLMEIGFPISSYQYTGLGSLWFIDFILFRRYLGIRRMVSVEGYLEVEKRVRFNKPYGNIDIVMGDIADYIPNLSPDRRHILWLDFDYVITKDLLDTIVLGASRISSGSLLFVTVDAEPPVKGGKAREWRLYFEEEAGEFLGNLSQDEQFARSKLIEINCSIIERAIRQGLAGRNDAKFFPLVNFVYADGHSMISLGGMIGSDEDGRKIQTLNNEHLPFLRDSFRRKPYEIKVPLLTRKERLYLDSAMPSHQKWVPKEFVLKPEELRAYREIYPYFPGYTEMLL